MELIALTDGTLDPKDVYLCMGTGGSDGSIRPEISEVIKQMRYLAMQLIQIRYTYTLVPIKITGESQVLLNQEYPLHCSTKFFEGASQAAIILVTIGPGLEEESAKLFGQGQLLEGLTLDAYGIAALNYAQVKIRNELCKRVDTIGHKLGYSLNPGCHTIPLAEQKIVFSMLNADALGVKLSESWLMLPVKSTSLIIPTGEKLAKTNQSTHACEICNRQNSCTYKAH